ncbi:DUF3261 domain-containing protein [Pseudoalteromonas sp. FUC4]|nr:DUF3261 domain-containing protein [Pseudoalteromonas sp. FUC4]
MLLSQNMKIAFIIIFIVFLNACQIAYKPKVDTALFEPMLIPNEIVGKGWLEKFQFSGVVEQSMLVSTEFSEKMIKVAALSFEGVPLSQLQFNTHTNQLTTTNSLGVDFDGKKIIYDMQSAFWPLAQLKQHICKNCQVTQTTIAGQLTRRFYRGETLIREVIYNGSHTQLVENEQNYRLTIERLEEY